MNPLSGAPSTFSFLFITIFVIIAATFLFNVVKGLTTWTSNNAAELQSEPCKVVAKRTKVWGGGENTSASTNYYVTFEFPDANRIELQVRANHYGMIAEGDYGTVTFQGTRFKDFSRSSAQ